jgi:enoyl-CoA hydratase/carnithine racemase
MTPFTSAASLLSCLLLTQLGPGTVEAQLFKPSCINHDCSAKRFTLSNPPVNLWDANVIGAFNALMNDLKDENQTKVVAFDSGTPDFWAAPIDLNLFTPGGIPGINASAVIEQYYENLDLLLAVPVIFIGEVNGRAWGAGDEHLLRMDMRFAGPQAQFGAPEAAVGLIHVGGLQQLTRLIGPGRAAEYMLAAAQVTAAEAANVGWVNSVHPSVEELRNHVNELAARIALFPIEAIRATKASIAEQAASKTAFENDLARFNQLGALPIVQENIATILELSHNQSKSWEENNNDNIIQQLY